MDILLTDKQKERDSQIFYCFFFCKSLFEMGSCALNSHKVSHCALPHQAHIDVRLSTFLKRIIRFIFGFIFCLFSYNIQIYDVNCETLSTLNLPVRYLEFFLSNHLADVKAKKCQLDREKKIINSNANDKK